jgi:hypothetical protein
MSALAEPLEGQTKLLAVRAQLSARAHSVRPSSKAAAVLFEVP